MELILDLADATCRLVHWLLYLFWFDFAVAVRANDKHQAADKLSLLATTREDQAPIEGNVLVPVHKTTSDSNASIHFVPHMTVPFDEADVQAEAQIVEDNDAEKGGEHQKLQAFLRHRATDGFRRQAAESFCSSTSKLSLVSFTFYSSGRSSWTAKAV